MEGSQFLQTPPSSEQDEVYGGVHVVEADDEDDEQEDNACVSCEEVLSLAEKGPRCLNCYRAMREKLHESLACHEKLELSPETPRKLIRSRAVKEPASCFGKKRARQIKHESDDEVDEPDLKAYFALFEGFSELDQVKYCRAYATMLATRSVKNRTRYSKSVGVKFAQ